MKNWPLNAVVFVLKQNGSALTDTAAGARKRKRMAVDQEWHQPDVWEQPDLFGDDGMSM